MLALDEVAAGKRAGYGNHQKINIFLIVCIREVLSQGSAFSKHSKTITEERANSVTHAWCKQPAAWQSMSSSDFIQEI